MPSIHDLLKSGTDKLKHLDTPLLDTEVLLSYVLQKPREYLLAHGEDEVTAEQERQFDALVAERAQHKPVAYLVKHKEFYGRDFYVDERVHIPRPATEDMVRAVIDSVPADFGGVIADIGTGSGCIAITLALELPNANIIATDISPDALAVARQNAATLGAKIDFYQGDLLSPLPAPVDIIVSNPPYGWPQATRSSGDLSSIALAKEEVWSYDPGVFFQPKESYDGGAEGLEAIQHLLSSIPTKLLPNGKAFIEHDPRQRRSIEKIARATGYNFDFLKDTEDFDRVIRLTK